MAARPRAPQPGVEARQCPDALTQSASCLSSWWGPSHLAQPWSPGVLTSAHLLARAREVESQSGSSGS